MQYKYLILAMLFFVNPLSGKSTMPPQAKKEITTFEEHGSKRVDPYYWLKKRDTSDVLQYLQEENDYTKLQMAKTEPLQEVLFHEFKARIKEEDSSVPFKLGNYYYYTRTEKEKDYPIYCRKKGKLSAPEEILIDENHLAKNFEYYQIENTIISPNENLYAFAEDTLGRRQYTIRLKNLKTGEFLEDTLVHTSGSFVFASDSKTLFYTKTDPVTLRAYRIYKHIIGTPVENDVLVYEEKDNAYQLSLYKTKSKKYIIIAASTAETTECHFLESNNPAGSFQLFAAREKEVMYFPDHHHDKFIIRTNLDAQNFKIVETPVNHTEKNYWQPLIAHKPQTFIEDFEVFDDFLALSQREAGLIEIKIHPFNNDPAYKIEFGEPCYCAYFDNNPDIHSKEVRYTFSSMKTPRSVFDYNMQTRQKTLKKQVSIGAGFNSSHYHTERVFATAKDGTSIPISLVYRKDKFHSHQNPLLLHGYGAYGINYNCYFDTFALSLLDRGFVIAIAHIRGGSDMGREWYEQGKLLHKKNSFTDFIDAAEYLSQQGYASDKQLYAEGGSAGGLLMGAVMTMRPDLFRGIVASVPYLDVITTMLDPDIPLTTGEYTEWGDPNQKTYYDYMLSYSPYDNIRKTNYPNLLVISAYQDSQVQYWEPTKFVAKLRANKTDDNLVLLHTLMEASHSGVSGRFDKYKEIAFEYAFLLSLSGEF